MPIHGIKLDVEFLTIVIGALVVSYFISGSVVSNTLFTFLIAALFFLSGVQLDLDRLKKSSYRSSEAALGLVFIYFLAPMSAFVLAAFVGGGLGEAFIAIGISAAAIGSPMVFSNLSRGEGDLAVIVSGISFFAGLVLIPMLLLNAATTNVQPVSIALNNLVFIGFPLLAGIGAQRFENFFFQDFRHHFSKVALWLLVLVFGIQFRLVYATKGLEFVNALGSGALILAGFTLFVFGIAYLSSRVAGFMEREARTIGFVSGSKSIGIALFIASQISGEAVAFVFLYYFIRQTVDFALVEFFRNSSTIDIDLHRFLPNPSPE